MVFEPPANTELLAFPTAEGYGKYTVGGRGGDVHLVTNLNDSGPGSLRAAVEASGPRTVVFRVGGTIKLESDLEVLNPNLTIAGQTAPGDGIATRGYPLILRAGEVIVRYIRVRFGDESGTDADAITSRYNKNLIFDHVSASWSVDEVMSIYHNENVTVQWCLVSESLYESLVLEKGNHGFGGIWGSNPSTYHHNLLAHHSSRNPRFASGVGYTDYRNNVVYNWGYNSAYGGEKIQPKKEDEFNFSTINMVANYYKPGPGTKTREIYSRIVSPSARESDDFGSWYIADNVMEGSPEVTANNWSGYGVTNNNGKMVSVAPQLSEPWDAMPIRQQTAEEAYKLVLDNVGATLPRRDAVDARVIEEVRTGTATYEGPAYKTKWAKHLVDPSLKSGIIDSQNDVGGFPVLKNGVAPVDTDKDGMPDSWEEANGLNANDPSDRNKTDSIGYTMLENYLNSID